MVWKTISARMCMEELNAVDEQQHYEQDCRNTFMDMPVPQDHDLKSMIKSFCNHVALKNSLFPPGGRLKNIFSQRTQRFLKLPAVLRKPL
jgi:hypothetical protein